MAAALVVGQAAVGLMLGDLVSDDTYGRLMEPWHASVPLVPWKVADEAAEAGGEQAHSAPGRGSTADGPALAATQNGDLDARLAALIESARQAGGLDRISYRDPIAAFGREAIGPVAEWLPDPRLGAFAVRVLGKIAVGSDAEAVYDVLRETLDADSAPLVRGDIQDVLAKVEPAVTLARTQAWMAARPGAGAGRWTPRDAERLAAKVERLDARRRAAGKPALGNGSREQALALQFRGFGSTPYVNHCWSCGDSISSEVNARCDSCDMFFCDACGACMCGRTLG